MRNAIFSHNPNHKQNGGWARAPAALCFALFFLSCAEGPNSPHYNYGSVQDHAPAAGLYQSNSTGQPAADSSPLIETGASGMPAEQLGFSISFGPAAAAGPALVKHDRQRIKRFLAARALAEKDFLASDQVSQYNEEIKSQIRGLLGREGLLSPMERGSLNNSLHDLSNQFVVQVIGQQTKEFIEQQLQGNGEAMQKYFESGQLKSLMDQVKGILSAAENGLSLAESKKKRTLEAIIANSGSEAQLSDGSIHIFGQEIYIIEEGSGEERHLLVEMPKMSKPALWERYITLSPQERIILENMQYGKIISMLEARGARAIGVNMHENFNFHGMMKLSRFVKEKGIDVYVLGRCNLTCSNYLLPAAKNIHIGPYGSVMYGGLVSTFVKEDLEEALIKKPPKKTARKFQRDSVPHFAAHLKAADKLGAFGALHQNSAGRGGFFARSLDIMGLEEESLNEALSEGFAPRGKKAVSGFHLSHGRSLQDMVLSHFEHNRIAEEAFFNDIFANAPPAEYSYMGFLGLTVNLTGYRGTPYGENLRKLFSINRAKNAAGSLFAFAERESERPLYVFPSVKIMREIGLNIVLGKNHDENLRLFYPSGNYNNYQVVRVDGEDIINCKFFNGFFDGTFFNGTELDGIKAYGKGHLGECLRKTNE